MQKISLPSLVGSTIVLQVTQSRLLMKSNDVNRFSSGTAQLVTRIWRNAVSAKRKETGGIGMRIQKMAEWWYQMTNFSGIAEWIPLGTAPI